MGIWQVFQIANVLNCPIYPVLPNIGNQNVIKDLNRTVYCLDRTRNSQTFEHNVKTHVNQEDEALSLCPFA